MKTKTCDRNCFSCPYDDCIYDGLDYDDYLAENELDSTYAVCEVKRDKSRIDLERVKAKYGAFVKASGMWKRIKPQFLALSIEDM